MEPLLIKAVQSKCHHYNIHTHTVIPFAVEKIGWHEFWLL